tara:strand:- start:602 stop:1054 length:453 start_codon:yes stop_codon:yes gene_type:complete
MKKILIIVFFICLNSCGYSPIYSTNDSNFKINDIETQGNNKVNKIILKKISRLKNNSSNLIYDLELFSFKEIRSVSRDSKGNTKTFEMFIKVDTKILKNRNIIKNKSITENFTYNNTENKFDLGQYEKDIENKLIDKIIDDLILTLETAK